MTIGIVGTGISGLTLALRLQQLGVDTTLYTDRTLAAHRTGPIPNLACRFGDTLTRERSLGVAHWDGVPGLGQEELTVEVAGTPWAFPRQLGQPAQSVDFRVYLPALLTDYVSRGGRLVHVGEGLDAAGVAAVTAGDELVVVAVGRRSVPGLFERRADRSRFDAPRRLLCGGLFAGVRMPATPAVRFTIMPGRGEMFEQVFLTERGVVTSLLVEAVPGGPLEPLVRLDPAGPAFATGLLGMARDAGLEIVDRIDPATFALLDPDDGLRGAVTPTVRSAVATLPGGRTALAIGDAWISWDPIVGKGANTASACAWIAADAIAAGGGFDTAWASGVEDAMWECARPLCEWSDGYLSDAARTPVGVS